MGGGYTKRLNLSCHCELSTPATPFNIFNIRKCYFTKFLLRSEMMGCPRQPACLTPARASDNIYTQPIRAQVSRLSVCCVDTDTGQGLGQRSLTLLELTNNRSVERGSQTPGPGETSERIVKKGLMWVQQDKLFSRWKEMMISVGDEMTLV